MSERALTSGEIKMLHDVYGDSIDYTKVVIDTRIIPDGNAVTKFNTISFPFDKFQQDFSTSQSIYDKAWLVHEVAHVWQWQVQGTITILSGIGNWISNGLSYDSSLYKYSVNSDFSKMNIEQQASAIADRFLAKFGYRPVNCTDCSANSVLDGSFDKLLQNFDKTNSGVKVKSISSSTTEVDIDSNGDGVTDKEVITKKADSGSSEVLVDNNGDGKWDQFSVGADTNNDGVLDQAVSSGTAQNTLFTADKQLDALHDQGLVGNDVWNDYTSWSTSQLVNNSLTVPVTTTSDLYSPIGAFYESKSAGTDTAASIAGKTFRVLNSANQTVTAAQLAALDTNNDGKLTGTELNGLTAWTDSNEDGLGQSTELTTLATALANAGLSNVRSTDYAFFTAGSANFKTVAQESAQAAANLLVAPSVPASNYATLRASDNVYWVNSYQYITFGATQIKINNSNRTYLIGTDGNDSFDANYYAAYNGIYFNTNLLMNFLAGAGDDLMGGSARNDNLWERSCTRPASNSCLWECAA